jgi:WXG100 family type VII secretion target
MADTSAGGNNFRVTPADISAAATAAERTTDNVTEQLAGVKSYVLSFEGAWQGMAANTFQSLMHEYDVYGLMLTQALADISQGLRGNYANYTDSESQNMTNLVKVGDGLPSANFS